ncbi:hypothetical protein [Marinoscillum sp. MHG1-6]|uniref:hypothetical protein n=1 Tax=Marinoscillum sp. MHG1-6 TaxID=2959627 RepID=UPI0021586A80|nr:hypothetical protein [Marinoscillum sp. MHG1-6]
MKVKKIFIASVLKPVDDVRHYHKLACSLAKAKKYQIFILGKGTQKKSPDKSITFYPTGNFSRKSIRRLLVQIHFLYRLIRLQPTLLIICTPELLPIAAIMKAFLGFPIIYDVQENYGRNINHQKEYTSFSKFLLRPLAGLLEKLSTSTVDHFLLAEQAYQKELKLEPDETTILENKSLPPIHVPTFKEWSKSKPLKMLFSGSISEYSGVLNAIELFDAISQIHKKSELLIIGSYQDRNLANQLFDYANGCKDITLNIQHHSVDHQYILQAIEASDLGIIGYQPNEVNASRIPTKLFEYSGHGLPYLLHDHPYWVNRANVLGGAIVVNFENFDPADLLERLENLQSWELSRSHWTQEEIIFKSLTEKLINAY